jgi:Leucine-rich repeat (LRR) protein
MKHINRQIRFSNLLIFSACTLLLAACSQPFTVSVNSQAVYDPQGRLPGNEAIDANLQGCINLAMQQQNVDIPARLTVLSCADAEIRNLENIGQLSALRFLDLANNNIRNLTPLENLRGLSGLNLMNNRIVDIGPLLNVPTLATVNLTGNNEIPCDELAALREKLSGNLTGPERCRE